MMTEQAWHRSTGTLVADRQLTLSRLAPPAIISKCRSSSPSVRTYWAEAILERRITMVINAHGVFDKRGRASVTLFRKVKVV